MKLNYVGKILVYVELWKYGVVVDDSVNCMRMLWCLCCVIVVVVVWFVMVCLVVFCVNVDLFGLVIGSVKFIVVGFGDFLEL